MRMIPRYAVIPSNGRECLDACLKAIYPQVDQIEVVWTGGKFPPDRELPEKHNDKILYTMDNGDKNISRWWNAGIQGVEDIQRYRCKKDAVPQPTKWDVAVLNDDAIVPEGWFDAVAGTIRQMGVAAGCSGGYGMPVLHTANEAPPLQTRMQGFAFILAGELGLRADEQFVWYCGDDDLGRRAATAGGMVMVPGFHVEHLYPNGQMTPELHAAIAGDMQRYVDKYGGRPW